MDQVFYAEATQGDPFAGLPDVGYGFGGSLLPLSFRRFLFAKGFESANNHFFGGAVAAGAKLGGEEFFAVGIESHLHGHASVYHWM